MAVQTTTLQPAPAVPQGGSGSLLLNVGSALSLILLLILAIAWIARRFGFVPQKLRGGQLLSIKSSCQLGQRERVVVVEIEGKWLVLGVTAGQITHLHTLDARPVAEETEVADLPGDFQAVLKKWLKGRKPE